MRYRTVNATQERDFGEFYRDSKDGVFRAVLLATRDADRSEDAVSEAFARAFAKWPTVQHHPAPAAWVIRTALNSFRSGWRTWSREGGSVPEIVAVAPPPTELDPELLALLWRLPKRQRQVVALRVLADLDTQQTASSLGISPKTVTVHLHRALAALRAAADRSTFEVSA